LPVKRVALLALLLLFGLLGVGCGAAESEQTDTETGPELQTISAGQVVRAFRNVPGQPQLERAPGVDVAWEQLSFGFDIPPELQQRYGTFSIYIVEPDRTEAVRSLLRDKESKEELEEGANGLYWEYDDLSKTYVAYKRYGSNAVLAWWNEKPEPGIDARFERLDALMAGLTG
jgi:hypothetical protein